MPSENYDIDIDMYVDFINENLFDHFIRKPYSVSGIKGAIDVSGVQYSTYAHIIGELPHLQCSKGCITDLYSKIESLVSKTIDGIIEAKANLRAECGDAKVRKVDIHWREYPHVTYVVGTQTRSRHMMLTYRASAIQKGDK